MKRLLAIALAVIAVAGVAMVGLRLSHPKAMFAWAEDAAASHGNALWHIVHELCTPDMKASGNPAPCVSVDFAGGYAVLKDIQGKTQYLVIPTARVTGIESPELLATASPNYWAAAWDARKLVEDRIGHPMPREDIGLAVNSMSGRTQNQLHIHIDCIYPKVRDALQRAAPKIGAGWTSVVLGKYHHHYRAKWLAGADLGDRDPFKILADTDRAARADMGDETLGLIGASRPNGALGFILLSDPGDGTPNDEAAAEELLDHRCTIAAEALPPGAKVN
jgi:CDP-diacylglycerol pyrophosphatase